MSKAAKALKSTAAKSPAAPPSPSKATKVNVPVSTTSPITPSKSVAERLASVNKQFHLEHKPTLEEQKVVDEPTKESIVPAPGQNFVPTAPPVQTTQPRKEFTTTPPSPRQQGGEYHVGTTGVHMQPYKPETRDEEGHVVRPVHQTLPPGYSVGTGGMKVKNL